jgi:hypothetical protein
LWGCEHDAHHRALPSERTGTGTRRPARLVVDRQIRSH